MQKSWHLVTDRPISDLVGPIPDLAVAIPGRGGRSEPQRTHPKPENAHTKPEGGYPRTKRAHLRPKRDYPRPKRAQFVVEGPFKVWECLSQIWEGSQQAWKRFLKFIVGPLSVASCFSKRLFLNKQPLNAPSGPFRAPKISKRGAMIPVTPALAAPMHLAAKRRRLFDLGGGRHYRRSGSGGRPADNATDQWYFLVHGHISKTVWDNATIFSPFRTRLQKCMSPQNKRNWSAASMPG